MQGGRVHQVASPLEVYGKPATLFVGTFVGTMNVIENVEVAGDGRLALGNTKQALPQLACARVTLCVRPEDVIVGAPAAHTADAITFEARVMKVTYAGREAFYRLDADGLRLLVHAYRPEPDRLPVVGQTLQLAMPLSRLHAFDAADGRRIALRP